MPKTYPYNSPPYTYIYISNLPQQFSIIIIIYTQVDSFQNIWVTLVNMQCVFIPFLYAFIAYISNCNISSYVQCMYFVFLSHIASAFVNPNRRPPTVCVPHRRHIIGQYVTIHGDVISHVNMTGAGVEDGGEYSCIAENRAGKVSHSARLNIYGT